MPDLMPSSQVLPGWHSFRASFFFFEFYFFIQQVLISHQFYTHQCIHVNPNLPIHPTPPHPTPWPPVGQVLNLNTVDILGQISLCCGAVLCVPGLHRLHATTSPIVTAKNAPDSARCPLEGWSHLHLRTTALGNCHVWAHMVGSPIQANASLRINLYSPGLQTWVQTKGAIHSLKLINRQELENNNKITERQTWNWNVFKV